MGMILLVRHGQASWGAADYDNLSEQGHEQARATGQALAGRGVRPARVVAGDMRRHAQTARALLDASGWKHKIVVDDGWNEFDHVQMLQVHGRPDGSEASLSRQEFDAWFDAAAQRWIGGTHDHEYDESFDAFAARVQSALHRLAASLGSGETAVVCTSGGAVSWVTATLLGGGVDMWMRLNPVIVNASVTKIVLGRAGSTLVSLNDHSHLEPDQVTYR